MRIRLLATLSGRIVLGFAVLILTFGTISAVIVYNMELLSREIRLIRTGYLPLALETKNLGEKQDILWFYISNEFTSEMEVARAHSRLLRHHQALSSSLRGTEQVLDELTEVSPGHETQISITRRSVAAIGDDIEAQEPRYKLLQVSPPLDRFADDPLLSDQQREDYERAKTAFDELVQAESSIRARIQQLARMQSDEAKQTALSLERNERRLRMFSIYLGLTAVLVGLLIIIWATLTLRPLRRLRDAARRIAHGEYQRRIDEKGPTEVADLAREFNVMGQAIEQRERDLVRHGRLAAVGKMAAMIVHEVRNPLSAIGLNTELLEDELAELPDSAEARELCRAITTEVDRLTAITEQYLQVARLPQPKLRLQQLSTIVSDLAEFQREHLALRGVALVLELEDELPLVRVDETQIRQALLNLLRNGTDATVEVGGGQITISTRSLIIDDSVSDSDGVRLAGMTTGDAIVQVCVRDQGPGISEELAGKLFEPFFSTKDGGTGLGLALTHQIVREHGGDLRVDTSLKRGAAFLMTLPASDASRPDTEPAIGDDGDDDAASILDDHDDDDGDELLNSDP